MFYIDKTDMIYSLVNTKTNILFLSRPRRIRKEPCLFLLWKAISWVGRIYSMDLLLKNLRRIGRNTLCHSYRLWCWQFYKGDVFWMKHSMPFFLHGKKNTKSKIR